MTQKKGFWRSVAGAFVEFDEPAGPPSRASTIVPPSADSLPDADALLRELEAATPKRAQQPPPSAPPPPPPPSSGPSVSVEGDLPFATIYAARKVAPTHHTAEQLLAIFDGLAALPPDACRLAIKAMDDADEKWTVADVFMDARAKTDALSAHIGELTAQVDATAAAAAAQRQDVDRVLGEAEAEVQKQIAALQAELQSFRDEAAARHAEIEARVQAQRDALQRDAARVQAEIARLGRVAFFLNPMLPAGATAPAPSPR